MSSNTKKAYRHGDVAFFQVASLPKSATPNGGKVASIVVALGEVTGHKHVLTIDSGHEVALDYEAKVYDKVERYIETLEASMVTHEEHWPINLPAGKFHVVIQSEWTPEGWSRVSD